MRTSRRGRSGSLRAAGAAARAALEGKLDGAREEAGQIAAGLQESKAALGVAEVEAAQAEAHEERLATLLAEGEEREAELSAKVRATRRHLAAEKARLRRARAALAARLVAIYESGTPDTATLIFGSADYQELQTQADYLRQISESDTALASRVAEVRDDVHHEVTVVAALRRRAVAYDERLAVAREEIAAVCAPRRRPRRPTWRRSRPNAKPRWGRSKATSRNGSARLRKSRPRKPAKRANRRPAKPKPRRKPKKKSAAGSAAHTRSRPTSCMCESGGNYSALNPSSGAGGAYQVLPSTWELYGGQGEPQNAPKAEQDRIAAKSGPTPAPAPGSAARCSGQPDRLRRDFTFRCESCNS